MRYRLAIVPTAQKALSKLHKRDRRTASKIVAAIDGLASEPRPHGFKKLAGMPGCFRIRVGDYRGVYTVEDDVLMVLVVGIGHRKNVYDRLGEMLPR